MRSVGAQQQKHERRRGQGLTQDQAAHAENIDRSGTVQAERRPDREIEPACVRPHQEDPGNGENRCGHQQRKEDKREPDFAARKIGTLDEPCQAEADGEHDRHRTRDKDEGVGQDASVDDGIGKQRAHMLERPARTGLEGKVVARSAEGGKQQHRQRYGDQVDRGTGADGKHQLGGDVEIVELSHVLVSIRVADAAQLCVGRQDAVLVLITPFRSPGLDQRDCPVRMAAARPNSASRATMLSGLSHTTCILPECSALANSLSDVGP